MKKRGDNSNGTIQNRVHILGVSPIFQSKSALNNFAARSLAGYSIIVLCNPVLNNDK